MNVSILVSILVSLLFSAFFSGMEMAFFSASRLRLELDNQRGGLTARILNFFYRHSERFISTTLVGNNIALIVYGIFMARLLEPWLRRWIAESDFLVVLLQTVLSTLIILITGEYLPKTLFKVNPNGVLRTFAVPQFVFYWLLYPISSLATLLSHAALRLCGVPIPKEQKGVLTRVDLDFFVQQGLDRAPEESDTAEELQLFQNALDFRLLKVRDCMVPRSELTAASIDTPLEKLNKLFVETGYSKIPIYRDDIDNLVGYIHSSEMFRRPQQWQQRVIPIPFVPETMPANKVLRLLMERKKSIAAVVDEFGGTAGIVTMEDLFEEIIGDIEDEHDHIQLVERKISDTEFECAGRLEISKLNEDLGLDLPESEEYLTLAGLVLHELQTFPHEGDSVELPDQRIRMVVTRTSATKIETVRITLEA